MTAFCNGGPSGPIPGNGLRIILPLALITAGLEEIAPWLVVVGAFLEAEIFDTVNSCSTDPPALPTFGASDITALVNGTSDTGWPALLTKVQNLIQYYFWHQFCYCLSSAPTPTPVPAIQPPSGYSSGGNARQTPCAVGQYTGLLPSASAPIGGLTQLNITEQLFPFTVGTGITVSDSATNGLLYPLPHSIERFSWTGHEPPTPNPNNENCGLGGVSFYPAILTGLTSHFFPDTDLDLKDYTGAFVPPVGANYFRALWYAVITETGQPTDVGSITMNTWCTETPGGLLSACCPPDPGIMMLLNQIANTEQSILNALPLAVHSFAFGTIHSNLSGSGDFALGAGTIAVQVTVGGNLPVTRVYAGDPPYYFDIGHITFEAASVPYRGERIVYTSQNFLAPLLADSCHFTLSQGVIATIAELKRGS